MKLGLIVPFFFDYEIAKMVFPDFTLSNRFFERLGYFMDLLQGRPINIGLIETEDAIIIGFELPRSIEIGLSKVQDVHGVEE